MARAVAHGGRRPGRRAGRVCAPRGPDPLDAGRRDAAFRHAGGRLDRRVAESHGTREGGRGGTGGFRARTGGVERRGPSGCRRARRARFHAVRRRRPAFHAVDSRAERARGPARPRAGRLRVRAAQGTAPRPGGSRTPGDGTHRAGSGGVCAHGRQGFAGGRVSGRGIARKRRGGGRGGTVRRARRTRARRREGCAGSRGGDAGRARGGRAGGCRGGAVSSRPEVQFRLLPQPVDRGGPGPSAPGAQGAGKARRAPADDGRGAGLRIRRGVLGWTLPGDRPGARVVARPRQRIEKGRLGRAETDPDAGLRGDARRLPGARRRVDEVPDGPWIRRAAGGRHGSGQDGAGDRLASGHAPRRGGAAPGRRPAFRRRELAPRMVHVRADCLGLYAFGGSPRPRQEVRPARRNGGCRPDELSAAPARLAAVARADMVRACPGRGADGEESGYAARARRAGAFRRAPRHADGHAGREFGAGYLEPRGLSEPGFPGDAPRLRRAVRQAARAQQLRVRRGPSAACARAVRPAPAQDGPGDRARARTQARNQGILHAVGRAAPGVRVRL